MEEIDAMILRWGAEMVVPHLGSDHERYEVGYRAARKIAAGQIVEELGALRKALFPGPMYDFEHRRLRICDVCLEKLCPGDEAEMITISSMFGPCMVCGDPKSGHSYITRFGEMPQAKDDSSLPVPQGGPSEALIEAAPKEDD